MEKKVLLGFSNNGEVVFANIKMKGYFSASFDSSYPQAITEDDIKESVESLIEGCGKDWAYDKLEYYDCKPSELAEKLRRDTHDEIEEFFDISLYPESFQIEGVEDDIYFLSSSGGQHDTREEGMKWYVDKEFYDYLHELWDNYHLKDLPEEEFKKLEKMIADHETFFCDNEYKIVEQWLRENKEQFVK